MTVPLPNMTDYLAFIRAQGIPVQALPDDSPIIQVTFDLAMDWVYRRIQCASRVWYARAVYLFALDRRINFASDPIECGTDGYFATLRSKLGINTASTGIIQASSDNSTSQSWMIPDALKNLSLADLQNLKTPYGREYLAIASQFSPIWGLT